jgi:hypothetical protein
MSIYVRRVHSRGTGPYFQLVESYRREGARTPRTRVLVHLGEHETPEAALAAWPSQVLHLRRIRRDRQAEELQRKLDKLWELVKREEEEER